MPTIGSTPRPAYVYDAQTDTWVPVGVTPHTHTSAISDVTGLQASLDSKALATSVPNYVGAKNFIINGGMEIAQRGTTFTNANSIYTLDRWFYTSFGTSTTANVSQGSTDSVPGIQYYLRVAANSATLSNYNLTHTIETANVIPLRGKVVTVSFWMRTPVAFSNVFVLNLRYSTSTDARISNAGTGTIVGTDQTFAGSSTWTQITRSFTIPTDASSLGFVLGTYNNAAATAYFDITGVQLEVGSAATAFSRTGGTIQGERAACQRYYWRVYNPYTGVNNALPFTGVISSGNQAWVQVSHPVTMRTTPTALDYANIGFYVFRTGGNYASGTWVLNTSSPDASGLVYTTSSGLTFNDAGITNQTVNGTNVAYFGLSAEL